MQDKAHGGIYEEECAQHACPHYGDPAAWRMDHGQQVAVAKSYDSGHQCSEHSLTGGSLIFVCLSRIEHYSALLPHASLNVGVRFLIVCLQDLSQSKV